MEDLDDSFIISSMDIDDNTVLGNMNTEPADIQATDNSKQIVFGNPGNGDYRKGMDPDKLFADANDQTNATSEALYKAGEGAKQQTHLQDQYLNGGKTKANPKADIDVSTQDPFGNYNNMGWEDTLRMSRLADAYNSQRHWEKGRISLDGTGADNRYVQNTPVQTEEQRRAGITRDLNKQQAQLTLERNNASLAYPLELQKMFDKTSDDAYRASMEIQRNWADNARRARFDAQFRQEYAQALQKDLMFWSQEMSQYQNNKVATIIWNMMESDPQFAAWLSTNMTTSVTPSQDQYLANNVIQAILNSGRANGLDNEQIWLSLQELFGQMSGVQAAASGYYNTVGGIQAMQGALGGLTGNANYGTVVQPK